MVLSKTRETKVLIGGKLMGKRIAPPIITIGTILCILAIVIVARCFIPTKEENSTSVLTYNGAITKENGLNKLEQVALTKISCMVKEEDSNQIKSNSISDVYLNCLEKQFVSKDIHLNKNKANELIASIEAMNQIINLENQTNIEKMSIDGRDAATKLCEQIYSICGLKLMHNLKGDILKISDAKGNILYENDSIAKQNSFNFSWFVLVFVIMIGLLTLCVIIAKKNQLFIKDGDYDGFKENEFA